MILCMKFGSNLMKTVEGVVFWKSWNQRILQSVPNDPKPHPTISRFRDIPHFRFPIDSYAKISKCHKIFNFLADRQNIHNLIFPYDCRTYHKVWQWSDKNYRRSSIFKFPAPYCSVLTKISSAITFFNFGRSPKTVTDWIPSWPTYLQ